MLPANRKIKLLAAKLSSLKTELSLSREIFTSASKEVEKLFYEKHPDGRTQGIVIEFSGDVTKSNFPDYKNSKDVCLLELLLNGESLTNL